ncbi:hypothetical protein G6539_21735, partial [Streptomyces albidoflavus]|nr:hypothetical protein [Streptomyces albidoflavus]
VRDEPHRALITVGGGALAPDVGGGLRQAREQEQGEEQRVQDGQDRGARRERRGRREHVLRLLHQVGGDLGAAVRDVEGVL